ncbi:MAG: hypothetical protein AAF368_09650, partial [Planctomycetota bacterium]
SLNGVTSGLGGLFRHCGANYGVGNAAVARFRRSAGSDAIAFLLRRQKLVYYLPRPGYLGVDSLQYVVTTGALSSADAGAPVGLVGLHVRDCRRHDLDRRTRPTRALSPLCPCLPSEASLFGTEPDCERSVGNVCLVPTIRPNWQRLCTACMDGHYGSTHCKLELERATTLIAQQGDCDDLTPADCRFELHTQDGPEPYLWYPSRTALLTPFPDALRPLGTANPGDGFSIPR